MKESLSAMITLLASSEANGVISFADVILNFLMLTLTVISVICAFRAYKHQKLRGQKEASCNLAKVYAEDILKRTLWINYVFENDYLHSSEVDEKKNAITYPQKLRKTQFWGFKNKKARVEAQTGAVHTSTRAFYALNTRISRSPAD